MVVRSGPIRRASESRSTSRSSLRSTGLAVGGGVVLVQFADLAVAAEDAWFSYPEAKIGFTGGLITSMVTRIPHKIAMEFLLVGEKMTAERAYEIGFVNRVVPGDQLMEASPWTMRHPSRRQRADGDGNLKGVRRAHLAQGSDRTGRLRPPHDRAHI